MMRQQQRSHIQDAFGGCFDPGLRELLDAGTKTTDEEEA